MVFGFLLALQFLAIVLHDWVDIPGWTHGAQVQRAVGRRKLAIATSINALFPGLAVAFAIYFWRLPKPELVTDYWVLYCAVTVGSAVFMWYVPYFLGTTEKTTRDYATMYAGTRQILPSRGDHLRPNLLHVCFHVLFLVNLLLALLMRFRGA